MIDTNNIRKDFPQLEDPTYHFLDSAASSLVPQSVLDAMNKYYIEDKANVHRALYGEAVRATKKYEDARAGVASFINAFADEIIFTGGATDSSNMLVRMLENSIVLNEGDEILTTVMEHHSSLLPLQQLAKRKKLTIKYIPLSGVALDYREAGKLINEKTKIISIVLASNVTGVINDVAAVADMGKTQSAQSDIFIMVDATAAAGHIPIDVRSLHADALYFSGHKMLGPTGVGVLWLKHDHGEKFVPSNYGGHMVERASLDESSWAPAPTRFEAGTKNIAGVIGLGASVEYIQKIGLKEIVEHTEELVKEAIIELGQIPGLHILAETEPTKNIGIVSFIIDGVHPHDIGEILGRERVAVRPGHHCAMPLHTALGVPSSVRISFHVYNTKDDIKALLQAIKKAQQIFN